MNKSKTSLMLIIIVIAIITIIVVSIVMMITGPDKSDEILNPNIEDVISKNDDFVSTEENPYDTSIVDYVEDKKEKINDEDLVVVKSEITPMIAEAHWNKALSYIQTYFKTHSNRSEEGKELQRYLNDLNIMIQMSGIPESEYYTLFKLFEAPETFLACMVYYPPSVKLSGFIKTDSLVPSTEGNDLTFYDIKIDNDEEKLEDLNKNYDNEYKQILVMEFKLDKRDYIAYIAEKNTGTYMIYDIDAISEDSYFMTVEKWKKNLEYKNRKKPTSEIIETQNNEGEVNDN